jgi:hypothetical protein
MPFGCKRSMPFLYGAYLEGGGSSKTPTSIVFHGPDVDEHNDNYSGRRLNQFVKTKVGDNIQIGLCNLNLEVEGEVAMIYGDEEHVLGDNETLLE